MHSTHPIKDPEYTTVYKHYYILTGYVLKA